MLKASSDVSNKLIVTSINSKVQENVMPSEWGDSLIFSAFKGKGEAIDRGNYHDLKLTNSRKIHQKEL